MPTLARPPRKKRESISIDEARARLQELEQDTTTIKGIGQSKSEDLSNMGIDTVDDMLRYLPRRYDDYTELSYIAQLQPDTVTTVIGTVSHTEVRTGRNNRQDFFMTVDDGSGQLNVLFFGQHFLIRNIRRGQQLVSQWKSDSLG